MPRKGSRKTHCIHGHSLEGYSGGCRTCSSIRYGKWVVDNPEGWKSIIRKYTYRLDKEQFKNLLKEQEGKCAVCGEEFGNKRPTSPSVDHDHKCCSGRKTSCGKCTRGLLCHNCNIALGLFKDKIESLEKAVQYLKLWNEKLKETQ